VGLVTGKNTLSRIVVIAALSLGAFALAHAQTPPPTGGGDKPAGGDAKPAGEKPADKPPEKFHSPFNGDLDPGSAEAQDFGKLLDLYDAMLDAQAALAAAEKCNGDVKKAKDALDKATAAFDEAFDEYVIGWDTSSGSLTLNWYRSKVKDHSKPYMKGGKAQKTLDALQKADKKKHDAAACPPPGETPPTPKTGGDIAPEHSSLPPCDDGDKVAARIESDETELSEVMDRERMASGDSLASLRAEEAGLHQELAGLNGLKACPSDYHPPKDEGGSTPAVTIGIGVGIGGDDNHHRHDDRDRHRDDRDKPRDDYNR